MAPKDRLRPWLKELFFEENPTHQRNPSRVAGLVAKAVRVGPQLFALAFCNFGARYPRTNRILAPAPVIPNHPEVVLDQWPRSSTSGISRGLPFSNASVGRLELGPALHHVSDFVFAIRELHRVMIDGGIVHGSLAAVAGDPTVRQPVTPEMLRLCSSDASEAQRNRATQLGIADLFTLSVKGETFELGIRKPAAPSAHPRSIDIGCGSSPRAGFIGIDMFELPGVSIVRNVDRHGLPFSDSTIAAVHSAHFLEHVDDLVFVMNEIHRVCCHDALVDISVPSLLGPYAAADPTHRHFFNARTFSYFEEGSPDYAGITKGYEILEQSAGFSIVVKLRVLKA